MSKTAWNFENVTFTIVNSDVLRLSRVRTQHAAPSRHASRVPHHSYIDAKAIWKLVDSLQSLNYINRWL